MSSTPITSSARLSLSTRFGDYLEMSKPRISVMVLVTVSVGFALGSFGVWNVSVLMNALLGVALVATGSSAWLSFIHI